MHTYSGLLQMPTGSIPAGGIESPWAHPEFGVPTVVMCLPDVHPGVATMVLPGVSCLPDSCVDVAAMASRVVRSVMCLPEVHPGSRHDGARGVMFT